MLATKRIISKTRLRPENQLNIVQKALICYKSELPPKKVKHFPYQKKSWGILNMWSDPFTKRKFDENSRIIQIEGNVACGKHDFAHQLAEELGMKVMPTVDLDNLYKNQHGYDYRALNPLLPERLRFCDWEMFHENPARHSVIHMQYFLFKLRLFQYIEALRHLFNTGQGVILVRSCFTELVFVEAMHNLGWLPRGHLRGDGVQFYDWKSRYLFTRNMCLGQELPPHLTIYLDTPIETCLDNIKNSENPMIAQSRALVPEFLENIEKVYRESMLSRAERYGHVLEIDHPKKKNHPEICEIIDEIKELNFDFDHHDTHFEGWFPEGKYFWYAYVRRFVTTQIFINNQVSHIDQPWYDIAGLGDSITNEDLKLREALYECHVGPFGYDISKEQDIRLTNPLSVIFNRGGKFGDVLEKALKSDFL